MSDCQNVQIPAALFDKLLVFFEYLDITSQKFPDLYGCRGMLSDLREKQHSINLRCAFTKMKQATGDAQKRAAYADYMKLKHKRGRGG